MSNAVAGLALTLIAGLVGGSVLLPMKYVRSWQWANSWLIYAAWAYLLFPWIVALATVPHLGAVYGNAGAAAVAWTAAFGFAWGFAVVLYGLCVDIVGLSLTSGILLGSSVAVGSIAPLLFVSAAERARAGNMLFVLAITLMVSGVLLCSWAGMLRDRAQGVAGAGSTRNPKFRAGIVLCLVAGAVSTFFNVALAYGETIAREARALGTEPFHASNAVWSLAVSAGSLPSLVWCAYKIHRGGTWSAFASAGSARNAGLCVFMGGLWITGTVLYGASAGMMGALGPVVGWPVYMSSQILASNFWGWFTNEWKGANRLSATVMYAGIALQVVAMVLLQRAQ